MVASQGRAFGNYVDEKRLADRSFHCWSKDSQRTGRSRSNERRVAYAYTYRGQVWDAKGETNRALTDYSCECAAKLDVSDSCRCPPAWARPSLPICNEDGARLQQECAL